MPYLIDGHNLIAQMPGLALADPDDEARLVMHLRRFAARKRQPVTVVFDHGIPGGWSRELSTGPVEVVFAGSHTNADRIIQERIRESRSPRTLKVVSTDGGVRRAAEARRAETITSQEFARVLTAPSPQARPKNAREDVHLSNDEIREWMRLFKKGKE